MQGNPSRGIERLRPDFVDRKDAGLNILRGASPDILTLLLLAAACLAAVLLAVVLVRSRRPVEVLEPSALAEHQLAAIARRLEALEQGVAQITAALPSTVQGVGMVRFNPFPEMGGTMSFSLALLDGRENGVVVTVLNDRQGSRAYGKPVEAGVSTHKLSDEEQQALGLARARRS